jgi:hypothetical protein
MTAPRSLAEAPRNPLPRGGRPYMTWRERRTTAERGVAPTISTPAKLMPTQIRNRRLVAIERVSRITRIAQRLEPHRAGIDHH